MELNGLSKNHIVDSTNFKEKIVPIKNGYLINHRVERSLCSVCSKCQLKKKKTEDLERTICVPEQIKPRFPNESQHETSFILVLLFYQHGYCFSILSTRHKTKNTVLGSQ